VTKTAEDETSDAKFDMSSYKQTDIDEEMNALRE